MKNILIPAVILAVLIGGYIYFTPRSLDSRLDDLEKIIEKYEPEFESLKYGSEDYAKMIKEYNEEIFAWAEEFEMNKYEREDGNFKKDALGNKILKEEFSEVEERFYKLNNRMTKMVLAKMPKKKRENIITGGSDPDRGEEE